MNQPVNQSTVQLDPDLADALVLKAAQLHQTVSEIVNQTVRLALEEDRSDLAAFDERSAEPTISRELLLQDFYYRGES